MNRSKKIAYAATAAAIGIIAMVIAIFTPSSIPYIVAGLAMYIVLFKCGYMFGGLTYLVIAGTAMLINLVEALPFVFLFGLHPFVSFSAAKLLGKLKNKTVYWALRIFALAVFFNLAFAGIYFLAINALFNLNSLIGIFGGYAVLAVFGTIVFILYDVASMIITAYVINKI